MSFTYHELRSLHRDLTKWVRSVERHLAAETREDGPPLEAGDPADQLAEISLLLRRHEAEMLERLASEIPDLPSDLTEVDRLRAALRYSFHHLFTQTFGEAPTTVETTGAIVRSSDHSLGADQVSPRKLPP